MFGFNAISYMSHVSYKCLFLIHVNMCRYTNPLLLILLHSTELKRTFIWQKSTYDKNVHIDFKIKLRAEFSWNR